MGTDRILAERPGRTLVIRADASTTLGTGHVMRCLAIGQAWRDQRRGPVRFACAAIPDGLIARLRDEGMDVITLDVVPGSAADAAVTVDLARRSGADWLVIDSYACDGEYQQRVRGAGLHVVVVDDYMHAGHYAVDLVLNAHAAATPAAYPSRAPWTRLLLGPAYALVRREFREGRDPRRGQRPDTGQVLVTLGGSDPHNVTAKVLGAFAQDVPGLREAVVVLGAGHPQRSALEHQAGSLPCPIRLLWNTTHMPELMGRTDVAVCAGGGTLWELACLGVPALAIVLADNQTANVQLFVDRRVVRSLGWHTDVTASTIAEALGRLLGSAADRREMTGQGMALVDGGGPERVVRAMARFAVTVRAAEASDSRRIWEWANDPQIRAVSFNPHAIAWEDHQRWYAARLSDPAYRIYIVEDADQPVGYVRFSLEGPDAVISVGLATEHRGRGLGTQAIRLSCVALFATTDSSRVRAYIRPDNQPSLRTFASAGFGPPETVARPEGPALCMILERLVAQWGASCESVID